MSSFLAALSKNDPQFQEVFQIVSMRKLEFILGYKRNVLKKIALNVDNYYKPFTKKKPHSDQLRCIDNPTGMLKAIQKKIYKHILIKIPLPEGMIGGVVGRSFKDHAKAHINKKVVVTLDLKDCFPRTKDKIIFKVFRENLKYSTKIAKLLTRLTTYKTRLPQGASSSSALVNLSLISMYEEMKKLVLRSGLELKFLTFLTDDIAFSGQNADFLISDFIKIIQKYGYSVRHKKIKVMRWNKRQVVTGIVINKKQSITKEKIKEYKDTIFALGRNRNLLTVKNLQSIWGKIQHVKKTNPNQAKELVKLAEKYLPKRY